MFIQKSFLFLLALISLSSYASATSLQNLILENTNGGPVEPKRAALIKSVMTNAIDEAKLSCIIIAGKTFNNTAIIGWIKSDIIHEESVVTISDDRSQPVVSFEIPDKNDKNEIIADYTFDVTTSTDFKKISSIHAKGVKVYSKMINQGTLIDPVLVSTLVKEVQYEFVCSASH